ncbi:hypothetical protein SAMN02745945_01204 [Peptoclostridium litorale DSM 5388]|uniref:Uncharacterized protein n=1 Tax=Peptoclostridium litorale DSM 5388 TaxID=1121324 RepID=A0A069RCL1_PEPLI|nr:hypothetical protein [Peptoclostridium litorale]KDR94761.1 hypothetical protein CLIT_13c00830 [Peptoclostridium litorale DSM 5388]SIN92104.1 hypothetical protein SAMN02745945_01204 [Peptoclostridium litorale DSM 5388]
MGVVEETEILIKGIYKGKLKDIDIRIINLLQNTMNQKIEDQSRFLNVIKEIEIAMINKDYQYISDLLKFEMLCIVN